MKLNLKLQGSVDWEVRVAREEYRRTIHVIEPEGCSADLKLFMERVQERVKEALNGERPDQWTWFLYGRNGTVGKYMAGECYYVPLSDPRVYPGFLSEMLIRINRNRLSG